MRIKSFLFLYFLLLSQFSDGKSFESCCGTVSNYFETKEQGIEYLSEFKKNYGTIQEVFSRLISISSQEPPAIDKHFYKKYGAFVFHNLIFEKHEKKASVLKLLLENGVHPFDSFDGVGSLILETIIYDDLESFSILLDSGKLSACNQKLALVKQAASSFDNTKVYLEALQSIETQ